MALEVVLVVLVALEVVLVALEETFIVGCQHCPRHRRHFRLSALLGLTT